MRITGPRAAGRDQRGDPRLFAEFGAIPRWSPLEPSGLGPSRGCPAEGGRPKGGLVE